MFGSGMVGAGVVDAGMVDAGVVSAGMVGARPGARMKANGRVGARARRRSCA